MWQRASIINQACKNINKIRKFIIHRIALLNGLKTSLRNHLNKIVSIVLRHISEILRGQKNEAIQIWYQTVEYNSHMITYMRVIDRNMRQLRWTVRDNVVDLGWRGNLKFVGLLNGWNMPSRKYVSKILQSIIFPVFMWQKSFRNMRYWISVGFLKMSTLNESNKLSSVCI